MKAYLLIMLPFAVSACGGGSGGSSGPTFDSLAAEGTELIETYTLESETTIMPTSGSATYNGVAAYSTFYTDPLDIVADPDSLSEVQMTANFSSSSVGGRAYNFRSYDPNIQMSGEIDITNGQISGNAFSADLEGTLSESGYGSQITADYVGYLEGSFLGDNAQAMAGYGTATGTPRPPYDYLGSVDVNAVFIADQ